MAVMQKVWIYIFLLVLVALHSCNTFKELIPSGEKIEVEKEAFTGEDYVEEVLGVSFEIVAVEGGTFMMGSNAAEAADDENPVHKVHLDHFYIGRYEVTQELWFAVMGDDPSYYAGCYNCPVEDIEIRVERFIDALNRVTGKEYRLPTEAEWEFAARGGVKSKGYTYSGSDDIDEVAWYGENSNGKTQPVGQKLPNELGLYDMSGNVWEPCSDKYDPDFYNFSVPNNPHAPPEGDYHVLRGGSWFNDPHDCRVTNRIEGYRNYGSNARGIRLARDM
ncbi:MAG: SUMF1/EgtB/PvdO family nonheme iron enzyme [Bacteroidota bacterium]|nr:SUMF1/EgtB/PvdO family nonheme iron enzyme [Bacteroidota bacterium]